MTKTIMRAAERMAWLLERIASIHHNGHTVAWDLKTVDDFVTRFPEADRTLRVYTMGPNSSPMLNRAAKRAEHFGYLIPGRIGTQDARRYNQRTWCRTWRLTPQGKSYLRDLGWPNHLADANNLPSRRL
jgi:hypothetical protein